jgi:hypothetical protein
MVSIDALNHTGAQYEIIFTASNGQPYTVEFQNSLVPGGGWTLLSNVTVGATGPVTIFDRTGISPTGSRFYRITTQSAP